jgi:hypothetical protein
VIVLLFSLYYWRTDPFIPGESKEKEPPVPKTPLWLFSLLYSIDTFLPFVEITGVTKWGWQVSPDYRWVFLAERLVGFALSALLALTIGSYVL